MKKQPEDLTVQKPLSLYPMKFDETVDILLATRQKKYEPKKRSKHVSRQISILPQPKGEAGENNG
jgi:ribosomal protein L1